jgi:predicted acyltransferase (DUF342 family)
MAYTSVNGTFTYTITNKSSYVFDSTDYAIIQSAFDRWDNIMTLDARLGAGYTITISYTVDVLEAGVLGWASIQNISYIGSQTFGNVFPLTADLTLNAYYLSGMKNAVRSDGKTSYYYVLLHEIGHILGIGSFWDLPGSPKVSYIDNGVTKYYYTGANALREYKSYFAANGSNSFVGVPIEDNGGAGTAGVHPEEGPEGGVSANNRYINGIFYPGLDTELMSGWLDSSPVSTPLSRITLGFLEDMGYIVNYNLADVYIMSWPATTDANNLDKAYIQGFLDVSGITTIRGETIVKNRLFVDSDVSINGFLRALYPNESIPPSAIQGGVGSNTFAGDVFMDSKLTVTGDVSMNQKLSVGGDVSMNSKMYVAGAATLGNSLTVNGATSLNGNLYQLNRQADFVNSTVNFTNGDVTVMNGNLTVANGNLITSGNVTLAKLFVTGDVSMNQKLSVGGDVSMNAKLTVLGDVSMGTRLFVNGIPIGRGGGNLANNIAIGNMALNAISTGGSNTALGSESLKANTAGVGNSAFGGAALHQNTTGSGNNAFGPYTLYNNLDGSNNSGVGASSLFTNSSGASNNAFGNSALYKNSTGSRNTAIGNEAGRNNTTTNSNTFLGYQADLITEGANLSNSTAIGAGAKITASNQIVLGTTGETVLVPGKTALLGDISMGSTGSRVDICGNLYAQYVPNSIPQAAIIGGVGSNNFTADVSMNAKLTVVGDVSMGTKLTVNGITISRGGGNMATNSAFGSSALNANTTGQYNSAFGSDTLIANTSGGSNTAFGQLALANNTTGSWNSTIGVTSLNSNTTGIFNSAVGYESGKSNTIGGSNTFLGFRADLSSLGADLSNSTAIGANAKITASNQIVLGTAAETVLVLGKTALRGDISMGLTGSRIDICGNLYAQYPNNSIPQAAIIGGVGSNNFTADVSMNQKLSIGGDVSMNSKMYVAGAATLATTLNVNGITIGRGGSNVASNSAFGSQSLNNNGSGATNNSAFGNLAQLNTTTGINNSAFGAASLQANNVGFGNSAFGNSALQENIGGNNNTAFGQGAGKNNTAGSNNTAIGQNAGNTNTGSNNTFLGYNTSNNPITVSTSTAIGSGAVITASNQIVLGTTGETVLVPGKTALRGDISMGLTGTRVDICGNLYAQYPNNSIPQAAIIGGVGSNIFTADVSMNQKLSVGGDVSMNTKLFVDGDVSMNQKLSVAGAVTVGSLYTGGAITAFTLRTIAGVTFGSLYTGGAVTATSINLIGTVVAGGLTASGASTIGSLITTADVSMNTKLSVGGAVTVGSLYSNGASTMGSLYASSAITSASSVYATGEIRTTSSVYAGGLTATGASTMGSLYTTGAVSINTALMVGNDASMNAKLSIGGDVSMNSRLYISGPIRQW